MFKRCFSKLLECPRANSDEFDIKKFLSDEKCSQDQNKNKLTAPRSHEGNILEKD